MFQVKYLEGNMFTNTYLFLAAEILGIVTCGFIYRKLGMKATFAVSYMIAFVGSFTIYQT